MPVTHFDPYFDEECLDYDSKTACGVIYPEFDADATSQWSNVTCKRCLKMKSKLQSTYEAIEKHIVDQMGGMADFMAKNQNDRTTATIRH